MQRSHVQHAVDTLAPHDELTACLRMCGMRIKEIQALYGHGDQGTKEICVEDSLLQSNLYRMRSPSMSSTNAGTYLLS